MTEQSDPHKGEDVVFLEILHNYELCLRISQRTQQLALILIDTPELVTRAHLEQWEADSISVQPALEGHITYWQKFMADRHAERTAGETPPQVM